LDIRVCGSFNEDAKLAVRNHVGRESSHDIGSVVVDVVSASVKTLFFSSEAPDVVMCVWCMLGARIW
jgi:hypothetical protein